MARSLFRDKKRSGCLMRLKASMSLGRRRGYSKASTLWAECPFWNSLMEEFQGMAASSTSSQGDQVCCWSRTSALLGSSRLSTKVDLLSLGSLGSLAIFCCFSPFWRITSSSFSSWSFFFFLRLGIGSKLRPVVREGGGGGRLGGVWDLGTSFDVDPLFLPARRSLKPFLWFKEISSSSYSDELSGRVTTRIGSWAPENLSVSSLASDMGIICSPWSSSSLRRNWSISSSRDRPEEAVSSLGATAAGRMGTRGIPAGTISSRARNSGIETSILWILGSPALIAWPTS